MATVGDPERVILNDRSYVHPELDAAGKLHPHRALQLLKILLLFLRINLDQPCPRKIEQSVQLALLRSLSRVVRPEIDIEQVFVRLPERSELRVRAGPQDFLQYKAAIVGDLVVEPIN